MVVDDSASNRAVAEEILKDIGISEIQHAEDGLVALEILRSSHFDLVLTDLNMPGMDGIELLSNLAKGKDRKPFFVAVMSSVGQSVLDTVQNIADASNLELLGVFPKPINPKLLREAMGHYDPDIHQKGAWRSVFQFTSSDVEKALDAGQLVPFYQPKVLFSNRQPWGMEALVRWVHPEHGVIPPSAFVDHLESGPLALRFYLHFLDETCKFLKSLPQQTRNLHCSINLPVPLLTHEGIVTEMVKIVERHHLQNDAIVVELTETSLMLHLAESLSALARLRMKGFGIAMDDYGTGYSSMKQLARCPFNELKIDREFVHDATHSEKKQAILVSAISLCQRLNLLSVAEGVETQADWDQLAEMGCEVAQGYLISRPISADDMREWLLQQQF